MHCSTQESTNVHTLQINPCTLKILGNIAFQPAHQIVNLYFLTMKRIDFDSWPFKMSREQFRNRLSPEEMNRGVRMLESGGLQRRVAGILKLSQSVISRM